MDSLPQEPCLRGGHDHHHLHRAFRFPHPYFQHPLQRPLYGFLLCQEGAARPGARPYGIFDGGTTRTFSEKGLIKAIAIGVGAEDYDGRSVSLGEGLESYYQPMLKIGDPIEKRAGKKITLTSTARSIPIWKSASCT